MPSTKSVTKASKRVEENKKLEKDYEVFIKSLPRAPTNYALSDVAKALHKGYRSHQSGVLSFLRDGKLVASVTGFRGECIRLPASLWSDFPDPDFKVRSLNKGHWKRAGFAVPEKLMKTHVVEVLERFSSSASMIKDEDIRSTVEHILDLSTDELADQMQNFEEFSKSLRIRARHINLKMWPFIAQSDLHAFTYERLAEVQRKRPGRYPTGRTEELLLEIVRRIEIQRRKKGNFNKLPENKVIEKGLDSWWNNPTMKPPRPRMELVTIKKWVQHVRSAFHAAEDA